MEIKSTIHLKYEGLVNGNTELTSIVCHPQA
jgi:hypothetical protein